MKYYSLNHNSKPCSFADAVKKGLAPDRGLYFPEKIPILSKKFFNEIQDQSIPEMAFKVIKTATKVDDGNGVDNAGDQVVFSITVSNTSQDQINTLEFVDTITSSRGNPMSLVGTPTFVSATSGSNSTTLTVNGTITYTATFTVNDLSIKDGGLFNTITFKGSSARNPVPSELDTKDISDDGDTGAGDTGDDPTFVPIGLDSDSDGIPDNLDVDDDNDGVLDTFEQCIDFN